MFFDYLPNEVEEYLKPDRSPPMAIRLLFISCLHFGVLAGLIDKLTLSPQSMRFLECRDNQASVFILYSSGPYRLAPIKKQ